MNQDFTPRKEFLRQTSHPLNSFALLTFSSSSLVRLYSFPPPVVTTIRRVLQHRKSVSAYREDALNGYCEFNLIGKPWSNAKSAKSERLVVNVLAVILQHGYTLLSPLDYGRETDDRLALAFSKPLAAIPRSSASPSNHSSASPFRRTSPQSPRPLSSSHASTYVIPFAVSFASSTIMRVISPPRDSTPAILQAVRGSWPRGVISEKKVGESAYEFKLRGYRCTCLGLTVHALSHSKVVRSGFQEDTFAVDSLRHILNLLESLDSHAFTLLASLTLSGHSRVKDLWIFTGSSDEPQEDIKAIGDAALLDTPTSPTDPDADNQFMHTKAATMPFPGTSRRATNHARSASDGTHQSLSPGRLRESHFDSSFPWKKGSPRMRIPSPIRGSPELERNDMASFISGANDMTGVGAGFAVLAEKPDVSYHSLSGMPVSDANSPLTPLTDQTINATGRSIARPRVPALVPANTSIPRNNPMVSPPPPSILPPLRRAFSQDSYIADRPYSDGAQYLDISPPHPFPPAISTPSSSKHATPPIDQPQTPSPPSSPSPPPIADFNYRMTTATGSTGHTVSALLGPNAFGVRSDGASDYATTTGFRDSAYTTGTSTNDWKNEVPIRWTTSSQLQRDSSKGAESVAAHLLPGGWKPTPVEETEEDVADAYSDQDHDFPIPSYQRQRTPERHNADAPRSPEIIEQEDMGRLGSVGVVGVYGECEPEEKERKPSRVTPPQEGRPLRVSDSSVTRVPPNKLKRLSEGWVMVNVENSRKRPPVTEEAVPVPSRREGANPQTRTQRMHRGRSHSDPQLHQTAEQYEHGQSSRSRQNHSQKHSRSRDSPSKSTRDRDRSGHRDKDKDRAENRSGHHRPSPRRISGSSSSQNVLKGTTSHAAKAIAMIDAAGSKEKGYDDGYSSYATYPGIRQTPTLPRRRTLKKLVNKGGDAVEKSEKKSSKKSKKHTSSRSLQVD